MPGRVQRLWLCAAISIAQTAAQPFAILGDRTGETQAGVYAAALKAAVTEKPAFILTVGDTIQGSDDGTAEAEWREAESIFKAHASVPFYLTPGNHDIWSPLSEQLFQRFAAHPLHYSFDSGGIHVTVLDNSRSDEISSAELAFLEADLKAHAAQPVKVIVSHRPSWLIDVATRNANFPLHQLAKRYGVQYVIAGHIHQMLHLELEGVTYVSMVSSGGHLRLSKAYAEGWFFGYGLVNVQGKSLEFQIKELGAPYGEGRVTKLTDWGMAGLLKPAAK